MRGEWCGDEGCGVSACAGVCCGEREVRRCGGGECGGCATAPRAATSLCSRSPGTARFPAGAPSRIRKYIPSRWACVVPACRPRGRRSPAGKTFFFYAHLIAKHSSFSEVYLTAIVRTLISNNITQFWYLYLHTK